MKIPNSKLSFDAIVFYFWLPEEELNTIFVGVHKWWFAHGLGYRRCIFYGPNIKQFKQFKYGEIDLYAIPSAQIKWGLLREFLNRQSISHNPILSIVVEGDRLPSSKELLSASMPIQCFVADTHHMSNPINAAVAYISEVGASMVFVSHSPHRKIFADCLGLNAYPLCYTPNDASGVVLNPVGKRGAHACYYGAISDPFHPERSYFLKKITSSARGSVSLDFKPRLQPTKWLESLAKDIASFTCSLNGFPSVQSYAPLLCETCLITDPLSQRSELGPHLKNGENCLIYRDEEEVIDVLEFVINKPDEVRAIARAGNSLLHRVAPTLKRSLEDYCENTNKLVSSLSESSHPQQIINLNPHAVTACYAYEVVQELHRLCKSLFVCIRGDTQVADYIKDYLTILPRVTVLESVAVELSIPLPEEGECIVWIGNSESCCINNIMSEGQSLSLRISDPKDESLIWKTSGMWLNPSSMILYDFEGRPFPQFIPTNISLVQKKKDNLDFTRSFSEVVQHARNLECEAARPLLAECVDKCINDTEALEVADACDALGLQDLRRDTLLRALFLNRNSLSALFQLADICLQSGAEEDAAILLHEAHRIQALPPEINTLREDLERKFFAATHFTHYQEAVSGGTPPLPTAAYSILVVTNLFPPQELGGYGRKIWEYSNGLCKRGHRLKILTGDAPYLQKAPDAGEPDLESLVERSLVLQGEWKNGKTQQLGDLTFLRRTSQANKEKVLAAVTSFKPDFVLLGNFDFLGVDILKALVAKKIPVLHSLGNQTPGYHPQESIESPLYTIAPASNWLGKNLLEQGYKVSKLTTVYPGARVDRFFKQFLPDIRRLRIAFAGLLMPYKGAHVLMVALNILQQSGIEFEVDFAGDSTDEGYLQNLKEFSQNNGIASKVRFNGFLDRQGLAALFARCNVLVFPTQVPEAFGISQVEAMASGLIVITSGTGGTQEVIRHGIDGLVFEVGNAVSLARSLTALATNKELRDKLQINSQKRAMQFSVTNSVVRIESLAENLISLKNEKNQLEHTGSAGSRLIAINATLQDAQTAFAEGRLSDAEDICREILGKDERCAGAWHLMGKMAALQGDLETAGEFASVACELDPQNAEFVRELAEVFLRKKELEPAEQQVRRALELLPDSPEGLVLLGRILAEKNEKSASLEAFQDALRLRKDYAEGFSHYATALQKFGRGKDAISQIRKACALEPDSVEFQTNLAILLEQNARYVDALAAYGKAARMNPNVGFVWFRQGKLLNGLKRYAESILALAKAISLPGQLGDYYYEYGLALHMSKRFQEALVHYEKALSMGYNTAALQCNRGVIYKDLRKGGDAIMAFHAAVKMDPSNVSYLNNLGAAALELGLNTEALECFEQAVEKNPKLPTARNNIGNLLKDRARGMDALPQYRKSMELNPGDRDAPSNYLLCHMYIPDMDPKLVFEEHKKWGISTTKKFPSAFKFKPREPGAKMRVGFLSADLCHHPVAHFIEPIFRGYDRERFEFVAYGDQRKSDEFSARFAKQVDLWRETSSYDDRALAKLIHEDRVDILFELAGHTAYNRLGVFALKPAPVQVSYLGYPGTTGLPTIDFRITDAFADPQETTEQLHTEKLIRVSECAWCFEPDASAPEIEPLPALKNGYVTFGCFNNMAKLNPSLFETWAEILLRVPGSHLRLKARTLTDDGVRKELKSYFTERGIEEDRLDFFGHTRKIVEHLGHYHSVDIALDSFPYHGTTTTCEAMWMGCPVVTRAGKTHVSRVGVSLLSAVGLQELITDTREAYIEKAVALAGQTERLQELRAGMRERLRQSVLMDEKRFVQGFETALMEMATLAGLMRP
jgi:predicted O-linked N-acetylglucosamine transferase (SPINDLY family)